MRRLLFLAIPAMLATSPVLAEPTGPIVLPMAGKWEMNYGDDACNLFALFGEGEAAVAARLTRYEPSDAFELTLYGKRFDVAGHKTDLRLDFGLAPKPDRRIVSQGKNGETPLVMFGMVRIDARALADDKNPPPPIGTQQEASVSGLTVSGPGLKSFRLDFGSLAKPMEAMRACTTDLVKHWGFDPAIQAQLSKRAATLNNPGEWLESADFPKTALHSGHNGIVQIRLDVDESGKIAACRVLFRTDPDDFADRTCDLIAKRAKFAPAIDAEGRPIKSYIISRVLWINRG